MRELRLRYFIDLVSNIEAKAKNQAEALTTAQGKIAQALGKTNMSLSSYERLLLRVGGVADSSLARQGQYFATIAQNALRAQQNVQRYVDAAAKAGRIAMNAAQGAGAVVAGAYVAKTALDKPIDYDTRLRSATATAFAGKDLSALESGLGQLSKLVDGTVRNTSGATRDATLGAFEKLIGSGSFTYDESAKLLPDLMKTSVASRSDANDLVQAAEKMKVNLGLSVAQIPVALAKVMRAGQEGGFEIKDSAKWIGPLMPHMKGYQGMAGVEAMVTMLQQARSTAGTNDEAANNLRNFLQKIPADSTRKDFKKQGIDLDAEMAKGAVAGQTPIAIYMAQIEKVMAKQDPQGKARAAMKAIDGDKTISPEVKAERYQRVAEVYESAGISKIIADLQEFGGYSALRGTQAYGQKVLGAVQGEQGGAVTTAYDFMTAGTGAKATDVANRKDIAMSDLLGSQGGALNAGLDKVVKLTDEFPKTTAAAAGAAVALTALAAASGVAALLGGGKAGAAKAAGGWLASGAGKLSALFGAGAARVGLGGLAAGAPAAAGVGTVAKVVAKAALPLSAAAGAYEVGRLGVAAYDLAAVKNRDGVQLTPEAQARVNGAPTAAPAATAKPNAPLQIAPPDFLPLPGAAPAAAPTAVALPKPALGPVRTATAPPAALPQAPAPVASTAPVRPAQAAPGMPGAPVLATAAKPLVPPTAVPVPAPKPLPPDFARDVIQRSMQASAPDGAGAPFKPAAPDFLSISAPGAAAQNAKAGSTTEIKVGEGTLNVRIMVEDGRVQVSPAVAQQPSLIKINAGATNPGGLR